MHPLAGTAFGKAPGKVYLTFREALTRVAKSHFKTTARVLKAV